MNLRDYLAKDFAWRAGHSEADFNAMTQKRTYYRQADIALMGLCDWLGINYTRDDHEAELLAHFPNAPRGDAHTTP